MQANLCKHFNVGILKIWIICILRTVYFYSKYYFHIEYSTFRNIKPILISITIRDAFKKCAKFRGTWALLKVYEHIYLYIFTQTKDHFIIQTGNITSIVSWLEHQTNIQLFTFLASIKVSWLDKYLHTFLTIIVAWQMHLNLNFEHENQSFIFIGF